MTTEATEFGGGVSVGDTGVVNQFHTVEVNDTISVVTEFSLGGLTDETRAVKIAASAITPFTAAADTDGQSVYIRAQSGGTHSAANPKGGDIVLAAGAAGSGGSGAAGLVNVQSVLTVDQNVMLSSYLDLSDISAPAVSAAATCRLYYDSGDNKLKISENGGAYVDVAGGGSSPWTDADPIVPATAGRRVSSPGPDIAGTGNEVWGAGAGNAAMGNDNTILGFNAGAALASGGGSVIIGSTASLNVTSSNGQVIIGDEAALNSTSLSLVAIGRRAAADSAVTGNYNIGIGFEALAGLTTGTENIHISPTTNISTHFTTTSSYNVAVGSKSTCNGNNNVVIGASATVIGNDIVSIGRSANARAQYSVAIGMQSGNTQAIGRDINIGYLAGTSASTGFNLTIGHESTMGGGAQYNILLGFGIGNAFCGGDRNIVIGDQAVSVTQLDGERNIIIGANAEVAGSTDARTLVIAPNAGGGASWNGANALIYGDDNATEDSRALTFNASVTITKQFITNGIIADTIAADQNDYSPTGFATASVVEIDGGASPRNITGLAGGVDGRRVIIVNTGTDTIDLVDESVSSTAANRFSTSGSSTRITAGGAVELVYSGARSRWQTLGL